MEHVRDTSPYYPAWVEGSQKLTDEAVEALAHRDLTRLGEAMRLSYLRMHASMMAASPPHIYWLPNSIAVIRECEHLRSDGIGAWETMDAGPQVKVLCRQAEVPIVADRISSVDPTIKIIETRPGPGPVCRAKGE
jgi:diphosphomevalonate decarboxylase